MVFLLTFFLGLLIMFSCFPPRSERFRNFVFVIIGIFMSIVAAFRPGYADYQSYIMLYNEILSGYNDHIIEPTFVWITLIANYLSGSIVLLFTIYAILGVSLKLVAIHQLTKLCFLSLLIYLSFYYLLHEMIQIRVGVATGFFLLCIKPIYEHNLRRFLLFATCAILFHFSSIILLPLWLLKKNTPNRLIWAMIIPIGYVIYYMGINPVAISLPIPTIQEKIIIYQELQQQGVDWAVDINVFSLVFCTKIFIFYILLWKIEIIKQYNPYAPLLLRIYAISLFVYPALAAMPVLAGRLYEFLGVVTIILFPTLVYIAKPRIISQFAVIVIGLALFSITIFYNNLIY